MDDRASRDPQLNQLVQAIASSSLISDNSISLQSTIDSSSLTFTAGLDDAESIEQLGPIIKQISESNKQEAFIDHLDAFIRKKDGEIERMCNANYQVGAHSMLACLAVLLAWIVYITLKFLSNIGICKLGRSAIESSTRLPVSEAQHY
jgi:hypothetical protein